jgi:hypothetical protein
VRIYLRYFERGCGGARAIGISNAVQADPIFWPWSSARAHTLDHVHDPVLDCRWVEYFGRWDYGEWQEILSAGISSGESDSIRRATHTGEPLGSREFVVALERQAGRRLRVMARGRPQKKPEVVEEPGRQGSLFAGRG